MCLKMRRWHRKKDFERNHLLFLARKYESKECNFTLEGQEMEGHREEHEYQSRRQFLLKLHENWRKSWDRLRDTQVTVRLTCRCIDEQKEMWVNINTRVVSKYTNFSLEIKVKGRSTILKVNQEELFSFLVQVYCSGQSSLQCLLTSIWMAFLQFAVKWMKSLSHV